MSYDASAGRGDRQPQLCLRSCGSLSRRQLGCQSALRVTVVPCTSAIPALPVFRRPSPSGPQLPGEIAGVAILLKSLESEVTPELLSPVYSRTMPARSGCVRRPLTLGRRWHQSLEGPINLVERNSIPHHQRRRLDQTLVELVAP